MSEVKPIIELLPLLEEQVEKHLQLAIHTFQNLDATTLDKKSQTNGWSISQCLWHLNSYGHFYLPHIAKNLNAAQHKTSFKSGWFGAYFTKMMEPRSGKKHWKAFQKHIPPEQLDSYSVVAEFMEQQETLLRYLKKAHQTNLDKRLPISITPFIRLKLGDVFQFVIAHNERHIQQALRNLS